MNVLIFVDMVILQICSNRPGNEVPQTPLPKNDVKSWVGYRNQIKHPASSVTKPLSFTRADLVWLEPFLRFFPSLVGHFQMHNLGR